MTNIILYLAVLPLFLLVTISQLIAGEIPPPETIGVCCLNSEPGVCEGLSLQECFSENTGFGWSDQLTCDADTCVPDTQGDGDCCSEHSTTACESLSCSEAICEFDPYCCIFEWDDICVGEAQEFCGDICPHGPTVIVPTLNQWGMILLILLLGCFAFIRLLSINTKEFR